MDQKKIREKGATLLELIIVLAVFAIIIATVTGILISSVERQKFLLKEQEIASQVNFTIEYMARKIADVAADTSGLCLGENYKNRDYVLTHQDPQTQLYEGVLFLSQDGGCYNFYRSGDALYATETIAGEQTTKKILEGNFTIQYARFILNGTKTIVAASEKDISQIQPRVTMALTILIPNIEDPRAREKVFQTTVEKRYRGVFP